MDARACVLYRKRAANLLAIRLSFRIDRCAGPEVQTTWASQEAEVEPVNRGGAALPAGVVVHVMAGVFAEYIPVVTKQASFRTSSARSSR